ALAVGIAPRIGVGALFQSELGEDLLHLFAQLARAAPVGIGTAETLDARPRPLAEQVLARERADELDRDGSVRLPEALLPGGEQPCFDLGRGEQGDEAKAGAIGPRANVTLPAAHPPLQGALLEEAAIGVVEQDHDVEVAGGATVVLLQTLPHA